MGLLDSNTTYSNFEFPAFNISDSEKNKEWHRKVVEAITSQNINNSYDLSFFTMNECYNFYQGVQQGEEFRFLQEAEDGDVLPAKWINFNKIKIKIDLLLGELEEKGFDISVKAINKDAKARKLDQKENLRAEMRMSEDAKGLEEDFGLPLQRQGFIPADEEELDEFMDYKWKDKTEIIMETVLKYIAKRNDWSYTRLALFRDLLIAGRCFAKTELVDGVPIARRIDPRYMIFDVNATDDHLSDSSFFGEVRYMNIGDIAAKYGLSKEEIKEVYNSFKEGQRINATTQTNQSFPLLEGSGIKYFRRERGELRALVVSAVWVDYKRLSHKKTRDKYGNEHVKRVPKDRIISGKDYNPEKTGGEEIFTNTVKIWRKGTLIGGKIFVDWGETENMSRDIDNLRDVKNPYTALIPNYINLQGISKVQQIKELQDLKNIVLYSLQLAISRAGGKGFIYDIAQIPDDWDAHNVIKYLKTTGIAFINSKKDGIPATYNQFSPIDQTLSQSINQYISIAQYLDAEIDAITGINDARQGITQGASQAVGVTRSSLFQSNLATKTLFSSFDRFNTRIYEHKAGLVKVAWAGNERFSAVIGDAGIDFLSDNVDVDLDDYAVFIDVLPPAFDDAENFQFIVTSALQAGQIDFVNAMKLLREKDITLALKRLEKFIREAEEKEFAQQQQLQAQAAEEQAALQEQSQSSEQQKTEADMLKSATEQQNKVQLQKMGSDSNLEEVYAKGRIDLMKQKLANKGFIGLSFQKQKETQRKRATGKK